MRDPMQPEYHVVWSGRGSLPLPPGRTEEDVIRFEARRADHYRRTEDDRREVVRRAQAKHNAKARQRAIEARAAAGIETRIRVRCSCDKPWCPTCLKRRRNR